MSERRQRRWSWWVAKGAVAMAALAALSLAVTVLLAQRALDGAAEVVIRGDADTLVSSLIVDLWESDWPVTSESLASVLGKRESQGLRYLALVDRQDHHVLASAGSAAISRPFDLPGEVARQGRRVRLVDALARLDARSEPSRDLGELTQRPGGAPARSADRRPYLVLEFEPPVIERLEKDLMQITVVAAGAALVLVGFAFAWSHTQSRLMAVERQAEGERRLVVLGRASSVIAHELRNPLAALKGHAQLLVEDLEGAPRAKAERVVDGAERLERLTNVLLDFVRDGPLDVRAVTPAEIADRALRTLPRERVRLDLSRAPPELRVDAGRTVMALRNLVRNAIQATDGEAAPVEVRIVEDAPHVVLEVRDHGPGLPAGAEEHIFEPFVTTRAQGTGLGLWVARRIAEQHRGSLTAETHGVGGAVFRLVLPLDSSASKPEGTS